MSLLDIVSRMFRQPAANINDSDQGIRIPKEPLESREVIDLLMPGSVLYICFHQAMKGLYSPMWADQNRAKEFQGEVYLVPPKSIGFFGKRTHEGFQIHHLAYSFSRVGYVESFFPSDSSQRSQIIKRGDLPFGDYSMVVESVAENESQTNIRGRGNVHHRPFIEDPSREIPLSLNICQSPYPIVRKSGTFGWDSRLNPSLSMKIRNDEVDLFDLNRKYFSEDSLRRMENMYQNK